MKQGFSAGCGIEVTLSLGKGTYEFLKPNYYAGITEEWDEVEVPRERILEQIKEAQTQCRKICEDQVDVDIYDVKQVKLFQEILRAKGKK